MVVRVLLRRSLRQFSQRYQYNTAYLETLLQQDLVAFLKLSAIQWLSGHQKGLPPAPRFAAAIRSTLREDCGPCVQLVCDMALSAGVPGDLVRAVVAGQFELLPADVALAARFAEGVLDRAPAADSLRDEVIGLWGRDALITLAFTISAFRVYPALKYALGHGRRCNRVQVEDETVEEEQE